MSVPRVLITPEIVILEVQMRTVSIWLAMRNDFENSPKNSEFLTIFLKSQKHLVPCGLQDDACETDSITDWMVNGKQQYTIVRKCHSKSRDTPEIGTTEVITGIRFVVN